MKYTIYNWYGGSLENLTGYKEGEEISLEQVTKLIEDAKVNVMVLNHEDGKTCAIAKLGERFSQR